VQRTNINNTRIILDYDRERDVYCDKIFVYLQDDKSNEYFPPIVERIKLKEDGESSKILRNEES